MLYYIISILPLLWAGWFSRYSDWHRAGRSGDRIPVGRDFPPVQIGPGAHPASCTMGNGSFPRVKSGRGVLLTTHPLLVPRSWKSRAIPLPTLWATTGPVTGALYPFFLFPLFRKHQILYFFPFLLVLFRVRNLEFLFNTFPGTACV